MPVRIIAVGLLKASLPEGELMLAAEGRSVEQVLAELGLDPDLVAMVLVNGCQVPKSTILAAGDVAKLIPFVGGG